MAGRDLEALVVDFVAEASRMDAAELEPGTNLRAIGFDSLSLVSLAALIEAATGLVLDDTATVRLLAVETIADLVECLKRYGPRNEGPEKP